MCFSVEDVIIQADGAWIAEEEEEVLEGLGHPEAL